MRENLARRAPQRSGLLLSLCCASSVLAACSAFHELDAPGHRPADARRLHPISAELQRASLDVMGAGRSHEKQSDSYFSVLRFVRQYTRDGRGPLTVLAPRGQHSADAAFVHNIARANAVGADRLRFVERRDGAAHVTLSYDRIAAIAPEHCENWTEDIGNRVEAGPHANFGCMSQRNLANMVADPTDLVVPAREVPRGSDRRGNTYKAYVDGDAKQTLVNGK